MGIKHWKEPPWPYDIPYADFLNQVLPAPERHPVNEFEAIKESMRIKALDACSGKTVRKTVTHLQWNIGRKISRRDEYAALRLSCYIEHMRVILDHLSAAYGVTLYRGMPSEKAIIRVGEILKRRMAEI